MNTGNDTIRSQEPPGYMVQCLKRYKWIGLVSALVDAFAVYYVLCRIDTTNYTVRFRLKLGNLSQMYLLFKVVLHMVVIPLYTFSGSFRSAWKTVTTRYNGEVIASFKDMSQIDSIRAQIVFNYMWKDKVKFVLRAFAMVIFTVLLLTLNHHWYRLLSLFVMSIWFTVMCFVCTVQFIFFPDSARLGEPEGSQQPATHKAVANIVVIHTIGIITGWSLGNYLAVLDWREPYMFFPTCNIIGLCIGHVVSSIIVALSIWP
ncbi:putative integral membrane protein [Babesia bovis T2Bo]|uniref:putative integral membrane protein n=1 Tax=Babesia bovis T2Bo TaxID=484906 RepID=UPI001C34843F|nr:putative integral membrane protein [Babesia bovis T2Bo]EDO05166.2 putative integral membrane protein [Babesia bovis T2Bo]